VSGRGASGAAAADASPSARWRRRDARGNTPRARAHRIPPNPLFSAAKRARGPRDAPPAPKPSSNGDLNKGVKTGGAPKREGSAYESETRKVILTLDRASKLAPNGGKKLLDSVSVSMYLGAKIGVLGANGAGKSTLLRVLAGADTTFDGRLVLADGTRIAYLEQEPKLEAGATVEDNIRPAVARVQSLLDDYASVSAAMAADGADVDSLMKKLDALTTAIDACDGWEVERSLARATDALRCPPGDAAVASLSGGERRRVALARVLLEAPDVLLLDEVREGRGCVGCGVAEARGWRPLALLSLPQPTNHLDAASVSWLERTLADFKGTVVAVTHDRCEEAEDGERLGGRASPTHHPTTPLPHPLHPQLLPGQRGRLDPGARPGQGPAV
jgi:ABC-type Mn2+/Zn2+ transport system ATPase subunit